MTQKLPITFRVKYSLQNLEESVFKHKGKHINKLIENYELDFYNPDLTRVS